MPKKQTSVKKTSRNTPLN